MLWSRANGPGRSPVLAAGQLLVLSDLAGSRLGVPASATAVDVPQQESVRGSEASFSPHWDSGLGYFFSVLSMYPE